MNNIVIGALVSGSLIILAQYALIKSKNNDIARLDNVILTKTINNRVNEFECSDLNKTINTQVEIERNRHEPTEINDSRGTHVITI